MNSKYIMNLLSTRKRIILPNSDILMNICLLLRLQTRAISNGAMLEISK